MDLISNWPIQVGVVDPDSPDGYKTVKILNHRITIVPDCCDAAQCGHIRLGLSSDDLGNNQWDATPIWRITHPRDYDEMPPNSLSSDGGYYKRLQALRVKCCPFCGTDLPDVRRRDLLPEGPVHVPEGDGDHCETCKERSRCCHCWPPIIRWETVPA